MNATTHHTLPASGLLHVAPGLLTTVAFLALKPLADGAGCPPLLAFLAAVLLVDIPFMLGVMLREGKRLNGRLSLAGVVGHRERLPWRSFVLIFIGAFVVVTLLLMLVTPISNILTQSVFSGLPAWLFLEEQTQYEVYARSTLVGVFALQLVITGIVLPWIEELYFRGYLLPRISRFGAWAPLLGGLGFGLYHIWQLYGFATVFLLGTALAYVVWWKRDLRFGIGLHVAANAVSRVMFLLIALQM